MRRLLWAIMALFIKPDIVPAQDCLCFTANKAGSTIGIVNHGNNSPDVKYSFDKKVWLTMKSERKLTLSSVGDKVYFKGNNPKGFSKDLNNFTHFKMSGSISASGNVMSLIDNIGAAETITIPSEWCFYHLFGGTCLTSAPKLPASTLEWSCYQNMFIGCKSLTSAPELPATTLAQECYENMFLGCTSLTSAPELPATTLAAHCYGGMFYGCSKLTSAPSLPATTLESECYTEMFYDCTSLASAPELPATTLDAYCYRYMFKGCSNLTSAPELPATTLKECCYYEMFSGCTNLQKIEVSFKDWKDGATTGWSYDVAPQGTFICPKELEPKYGTDCIPEGWKVEYR